jgi:ketosteroid isomerase-like protein
MTSSMTNDLVQKLVEAYRTGDEQLLSDMIHDDIDWEIYGPEVYMRFEGPLRGKLPVLKLLAEATTLYTLKKHGNVTRIIEADRAALISQVVYEQRSTKRTISFRRASFLRFHQNLLIELRTFADTFDLVEQVLGVWIDIPIAPSTG